MGERATQTSAARLVVRWAARVTGTLLFGLVCLIVVGEGGPPNPLKLGLVENLLTLGFVALNAGLVVAWWREGLGAGLALGGLGFFYLVQLAASGRLPGGAFPLFWVPGILYALSARLRPRTSSSAGPEAPQGRPDER